MSTTFANSINNNPIYADRAEKDKDGNRIDQTYAKSAGLAIVATSGDYNDLSNKPSIPAAQVNSDWNAASGVAEILNKPSNLVQDANYVHTDENFTSSEKTKLSGIAAGAEVNVQADWNESNSSSDAYIQNKPTIPAAQVNADWNASSGVAEILNKPTIPAAQVNSDWNAASGVAEILNKPTILPYKPVVAGTGVRIVDDTQNNRIVIEADETVLWTGSLNSTSTTAPLSEVTSNFEKIKVYIQPNGYNIQSTLVQELVLNYRSDFSNDAVAFVQVSEIHSSITTQATLYLHFTGAYGTGLKLEAGSKWVGSTLTDGITSYPCSIVKIVGVNRIASN